jgi:hypothetical protein
LKLSGKRLKVKGSGFKVTRRWDARKPGGLEALVLLIGLLVDYVD